MSEAAKIVVSCAASVPPNVRMQRSVWEKVPLATTAAGRLSLC